MDTLRGNLIGAILSGLLAFGGVGYVASNSDGDASHVSLRQSSDASGFESSNASNSDFENSESDIRSDIFGGGSSQQEPYKDLHGESYEQDAAVQQEGASLLEDAAVANVSQQGFEPVVENLGEEPVTTSSNQKASVDGSATHKSSVEGSATHKASAEESATQKTSSEVFITRTGGKYHREGCRYLSKSKISTSLKDAKARGLEPCKVCHP